MIFLRSLIFNVLFYANMACWFVAALPTLLMPLPMVLIMARGWVRSSLWLMRVICGTRVEIRGRENIPSGPLLIASKHQSMWETFAFFLWFDSPLYILKRELMRIPVFGWFLVKCRMIGIDRKAGGRALIAMTRRACAQVREGRQLIIFPEGTRRPVGAPPDYKPGIAQIYAESGVTCLPVALNSGLFWPRRTFMRYPGPLIVEFLQPLPPGMKRREFMAAVAEVIESGTGRIVAEARAEQATRFGGVPQATQS